MAMITYTPEKAQAAFWRKVDKSAGASACWLWAGAKHRQGYGTATFQHRVYLAHRLAWEYTHWPLLPGQCVCHTCDVPACVNPAHLFVGTQQDNIADMCAKGRTRVRPCPGERNGMSKLTAEDVKIARMAYEIGFSQRRIAHALGVDQSNISQIVRRVTWKDLP